MEWVWSWGNTGKCVVGMYWKCIPLWHKICAKPRISQQPALFNLGIVTPPSLRIFKLKALHSALVGFLETYFREGKRIQIGSPPLGSSNDPSSWTRMAVLGNGGNHGLARVKGGGGGGLEPSAPKRQFAKQNSGTGEM